MPNVNYNIQYPVYLFKNKDEALLHSTVLYVNTQLYYMYNIEI